jgi:hypothetical protein
MGKNMEHRRGTCGILHPRVYFPEKGTEAICTYPLNYRAPTQPVNLHKPKRRAFRGYSAWKEETAPRARPAGCWALPRTYFNIPGPFRATSRASYVQKTPPLFFLEVLVEANAQHPPSPERPRPCLCAALGACTWHQRNQHVASNASNAPTNNFPPHTHPSSTYLMLLCC